MYYGFDSDGNCIFSCNYPPNIDDLNSRNEIFIQDENIYDVLKIKLVNGMIVEKAETEQEKYQKEAVESKSNLKTKVLNSMMMILNGSGDLTTLQTEYQNELNSVSNAVALYMVDMFPVWNPNSVKYKKGERVSYNDILYQVVTAHTSQESWKPDVSPSLFAKVISSISGEIPEWEQPLPTNAYKKGDKVRYEGRIYESLIDNNVWSPEGYPAGWKDITDEIGEG